MSNIAGKEAAVTTNLKSIPEIICKQKTEVKLITKSLLYGILFWVWVNIPVEHIAWSVFHVE